MTVNLALWTRRCAVVLLTAALAGVLTGCSVKAGATGSDSPAKEAGERVALRFDGRIATATLTATPESRQLAEMLPLTVHLQDVWGQAKSGRLPGALTAQGTVPVHNPAPGNIYFWSQTEVIAIYYDDLGQTVPDPGLVRLGVIDSGLDGLAHAGSRVTVRMELAAAAPGT